MMYFTDLREYRQYQTKQIMADVLRKEQQEKTRKMMQSFMSSGESKRCEEQVYLKPICTDR